MMPMWKLKREIRRLGKQVLTANDLVWAVRRRILYDARRARHVKVTPGQQAPAAHMAIFLLYQPKGLKASVRIAIETVQHSGAGLIFVSNLPLQEADRAWLAARSWRVIERPNIGYDFGGFREGLTQMTEAGLPLDRLWILNDSTWFPVCGGANPLQDLIDPQADVSGSMIHHDGRDHNKDNIESYFLAFTKTALTHPAFVKFWRMYPLYNNKGAVIRRGEQRLSRVLREAGLKVDSKMTNPAFLARLQNQSPEFVHKTMLYGGLTRANLQAERAELLKEADGSTGWRDKAYAHIARTLERSEFRYQYCYGAVHLMAFPFVKKGPDPRSVIGRARYLEAVRAGDLPALPVPIMEELAAAVAVDDAANHAWRSLDD
jgi:Rhamnan synthesis protein F